MEELKRSMKGGKILNVQRMNTTKEGAKRNSETVLIEGENMPRKVFWGFRSYQVRAFVPKSLSCFNGLDIYN